MGLSSGSLDTNFLSRSLLFIALGCYFAEILGEGTPVLVPENGPIALNFPLTPARRGSCSTRTAHPYFLGALNEILEKVGIPSPVYNPYELSLLSRICGLSLTQIERKQRTIKNIQHD